MPRLTFDEAENRQYENGVDNGILYTGEDWTGKAWNGLTSVDVKPDGGETEAIWADNIKYAVMRGAVSYAANINCYSFPEEFHACLGNINIGSSDLPVYVHEQMGTTFRMHYRTTLNDAEHGLIGYLHHVIYGLACNPSDMTYDTIDDSPEAVEFGFDVEGSPAQVTKRGKVYTACEFTFPEYTVGDKATSGHTTAVKKVLDILYGSTSTEAKCPDPDDLLTELGE